MSTKGSFTFKANTTQVSDLKGKCIVVYNLWFFCCMLSWMKHNNTQQCVDEANTVWFIDDVQEIISSIGRSTQHGSTS